MSGHWEHPRMTLLRDGSTPAGEWFPIHRLMVRASRAIALMLRSIAA
jgi:hypothetical protein